MNKMNKKGFTLIEMLVVIAIIAILVAIIIPVVGSSTTKAAAATDAANLRSAKAALTIAVLDKGVDAAKAAANYNSLTGGEAPVCKTNDAWDFAYTIDDNGNVTVYYGDPANDIDEFAAKAGS